MILLDTKIEWDKEERYTFYIRIYYASIMHMHTHMQNIPIPTMGMLVLKWQRDSTSKELTNIQVLCNKNQEMMHKNNVLLFSKQYGRVGHNWSVTVD